MKKLLKISLLFLGFQICNMPLLQARKDVFGYEASDARWNAITDSFDQAYGQDPNAVGIVRMLLIPYVLEKISILIQGLDLDNIVEDMLLDAEFDLDIAELAQAPHWYDNFIEQFVKKSNLKKDLYPTFYKLFAYIKDSRISNILQVYKDLPEEDKSFYAECLNDEISNFIKAAIVVEDLSDFE